MTCSSWQQTLQYPDHLGHPVVRDEYVEPDWTPEPSHQVPIQIYSLVPLDPEHEQLRFYLLNLFWDDEVKPIFEIYSYCPPDPFACIEHNRREIAYRKQQHQSKSLNAPPLIPQFSSGTYGSPLGCCLLLRSHSYRLGYIGDWTEYDRAGEAPDVLYFNRTFPHTPSESDQLHLDGFELAVERIGDQYEVGQVVRMEIFPSAADVGEDRTSLSYAMNEDEGVPPDSTALSEEQIRQHLEAQFTEGEFVLDQAFQLSQEPGSVAVTNTPEGAEPDLQYLIYVPFLSHLRDPDAGDLLSITARLFTAALAHHLPPTKTINFKFYVPESNTWSAILPAHRNALSHQATEFPIGALHTLSADDDPPAPHRIFPQGNNFSLAAARRMLSSDFRLFAVVLDRVKFVSEPGVYFYMAEYEMPGSPVSPDTEVWRTAGMADAARQLAMLGVEEDN